MPCMTDNSTSLDSYVYSTTYFILLISYDNYNDNTDSKDYINVNGKRGFIYKASNRGSWNSKIDGKLVDLENFYIRKNPKMIYYRIKCEEFSNIYNDFNLRDVFVGCFSSPDGSSENNNVGIIRPICSFKRNGEVSNTNFYLYISSNTVSFSSNNNNYENDHIVETYYNLPIYKIDSNNKLKPIDITVSEDKVIQKNIVLSKNKIYQTNSTGSPSIDLTKPLDLTKLKLYYKLNDDYYIRFQSNISLDDILFIPGSNWYKQYISYTSKKDTDKIDYLSPTIINDKINVNESYSAMYILNSLDHTNGQIDENNIMLNINDNIALLDNDNNYLTSSSKMLLSYLFDLLGDVYGNIVKLY